MTATELIKKECLRRLNESHEKIKSSLAGFSQAELWWRPNPASNSMGNIILHLCGNLTQYVLSSLGGWPDQRERSKEFEEQGPLPVEELFDKLDQVMKNVNETINACNDYELMRVRPVQCFEESGIGILIHVTEHLSYHTGQIVFFVKWKTGKSMHFYDGVDLEAKGER